MDFNDEQIADEKSIANMKIKYASLSSQRDVKVLQTEQSFDKALEIGQGLQNSDRYLQFMADLTSGDAAEFVQELRRLNNLELEELRENFTTLSDIDRLNPRMIYRPYSTYLLNRQLAQNELKILGDIFELYMRETRPEVRTILERIIRRRIESLGIMFLRPYCNR